MYKIMSVGNGNGEPPVRLERSNSGAFEGALVAGLLNAIDTDPPSLPQCLKALFPTGTTVGDIVASPVANTILSRIGVTGPENARKSFVLLVDFVCDALETQIAINMNGGQQQRYYSGSEEQTFIAKIIEIGSMVKFTSPRLIAAIFRVATTTERVQDLWGRVQEIDASHLEGNANLVKAIESIIAALEPNFGSSTVGTQLQSTDLSGESENSYTDAIKIAARLVAIMPEGAPRDGMVVRLAGLAADYLNPTDSDVVVKVLRTGRDPIPVADSTAEIPVVAT